MLVTVRNLFYTFPLAAHGGKISDEAASSSVFLRSLFLGGEEVRSLITSTPDLEWKRRRERQSFTARSAFLFVFLSTLDCNRICVQEGVMFHATPGMRWLTVIMNFAERIARWRGILHTLGSRVGIPSRTAKGVGLVGITAADTGASAATVQCELLLSALYSRL